MKGRALFATCGGMLLAVAVGVQGTTQTQHAGAISAADIEAGSRLYAAQCATCHGPAGNQVTGVDLAGGTFRSGSSDEALARTIADGVPGTAMRGHQFSPQEMATLIAFIRSMSRGTIAAAEFALSGSAEAGRAIVEGRGQCLTCHRINGHGARRAANLSDIGATRTPDVILAALVTLPTSVAAERRFVRAVTADGAVITGRRLNEDSFTVQLLDDHDRLRSLVKSELREYSASTTLGGSPHSVVLSDQERRDVVTYLLSLRGLDPAAAPGGRP